MNLISVLAIIGGILSIIGNAIAITWSFAKLSTKLDLWVVSFERFENEYKENRIVTNKHLDALWKRNDEIRDKVITLEAKQ